MGNLCSSGTDRSESKEEKKRPDKPKGGEDEALLQNNGEGEANVAEVTEGDAIKGGADAAVSVEISNGDGTGASDLASGVQAEVEKPVESMAHVAVEKLHEKVGQTGLVEVASEALKKSEEDEAQKENAVPFADEVVATSQVACTVKRDDTGDLVNAPGVSGDSSAVDHKQTAENIINEVVERAKASAVEAALSTNQEVGEKQVVVQKNVPEIAASVTTGEAVVDAEGARQVPEEAPLPDHTEEVAMRLTEDTAMEAESSSDGTDFLEKAKSLLEAHRNSIDENKMLQKVGFSEGDQEKKPLVEVEEKEEAAVPISEVPDTLSEERLPENAEELPESVAQKPDQSPVSEELLNQEPVNIGLDNADKITDQVHEETARDFVESIIERATSLVSKPSEQEEAVDITELPAPADETLTSEDNADQKKKRGVCFVSPQVSENSPSPEDAVPEHAATTQPEDELSPNSLASSISQGELVERDIELEFPNLPSSAPEEVCDEPMSPDTLKDDEVPPTPPLDSNTNDVPLGENDDDETIQRVAMEVTSKAVQDAIKIVTENGTGAAIIYNNNNNNNVIEKFSNNEVVEGSQSSPEHEEDRTTTDSSQVERGSSVSDLTDISQQGSITESLSSYDPGAVYRQDLADFNNSSSTSNPAAANSNTNTSSAVSSAETSAVVEDAGPADTNAQSLNQDKSEVALSDTPTPTNADASEENQDLPLPPPPPPPPMEEASYEEQADMSEDQIGQQEEHIAKDVPHCPPPALPAVDSVPSNVSALDNFIPSSDKPTVSIVINSPDSAPNTANVPVPVECTEEEESGSQVEALI